MTTNIAKHNPTMVNIGKSAGAGLIWNNATQTWNNITGTWNDPGQVVTNIQKGTVTKTNIHKS